MNEYRGISIPWFNGFKAKAISKEIPFEITMDYLADLYDDQNDICYYLGDPIYPPRIAMSVDNAYRITFVVKELGYVEGNIRLISHSAWQLKRDLDEDEFLNLTGLIVSYNQN